MERELNPPDHGDNACIECGGPCIHELCDECAYDRNESYLEDVRRDVL